MKIEDCNIDVKQNMYNPKQNLYDLEFKMLHHWWMEGEKGKKLIEDLFVDKGHEKRLKGWVLWIVK